MTRVCFLPCWIDNLPRTAPSARIRCEWVCRYWDEAVMYNGSQSLADFDVLVFQKCYLTPEPRAWPRRYKDALKVADLCDPEWLVPAKLSRLHTHLDQMDACVVPTEPLVGWYGKWLPTHVIPDCIDLALHEPRTGDEEAYFPGVTGLVWLGGWQNYAALETLLPVIATLGLPLVTISDRPFRGVPFIRWESVEQANYWIKRFDILLNPQPQIGVFRYKSNNKSLTAWACGVPVAHDAQELHELLRMTREERFTLGRERRAWVEENRGMEVAVELWKELVWTLRNT